ncbi:MAG: glycerol-3-phosphate O-acyltransferase [Pseudohongiellaceae bacterium]
MFDATVSLPTWVFLLLLVFAGYAVVMSVLFPSVRWFFRRRLNRAVDKLNSSLQISIRPLQSTKRQVLIDQLLFDQDILATIEVQSAEQNIPRQVLQQRVRSYAREIVPSFNAYVYYQVVYWLAKKASRFIYRVRVAAASPRELQKVDPNSTVVFVMNHRSNMDYVLISYLAAERVTLSYAVGEWARVFPLETLIRAMGAFFVRRGSQNPLYRKVLERYVYMATQNGVCQAVFLEGGLSRDGLLAEPKVGFIDYMLRHYDPISDRDVVFVPIGINYDRVLEDENLLNWDKAESRASSWQQLKKLLSFIRLNLFAGSRARWGRYGYASVNFGMPVSMRKYCLDNDVGFKHAEKELRIERVKALAASLMEALRYVMPIIPIPILCAVLLKAKTQTLTSIEIISRCDELIDEMITRGAPMKPDEKPRHRTLSNSLELLHSREMVIEADDRYQINPAKEGLINYYANSIEHWWRDA